jgi:hypothetical protein
MAAAPPPGLGEPFAHFGEWIEQNGAARDPAKQLGDTGLFLRLAARSTAQAITSRLNSPAPPFVPQTVGRQTSYDCDLTKMKNAGDYRDWQQWNILAYLEELQRTRHIRVLVVHWPIAHEPVGDCYNVRYSNTNAVAFVEWLAQESRTRGLAYLDLHDLLPADQFIDSRHVSAAGHRRIAAAIASALDPILSPTSARLQGRIRH